MSDEPDKRPPPRASDRRCAARVAGKPCRRRPLPEGDFCQIHQQLGSDDPRQCSATAKGTSKQCEKSANKGSTVCSMHGAGTHKRLTEPGPDGRIRKDPTVAAVKSGAYSRRTKARFADAYDELRVDEESLFDLAAIQARLWTALMTADEVEYPFKIEELDDPEHVKLCDCGSFYRRSEIAKDILGRVAAVRHACRDLLDGVRVRQRLDDRKGPTITKAQLTATLLTVAAWVHELAANVEIPRQEIAAKLVERYERAHEFLPE